MSELGIDLSGYRSKHVHEFDGQYFDYVITVADSTPCTALASAVPTFLVDARTLDQ